MNQADNKIKKLAILVTFGLLAILLIIIGLNAVLSGSENQIDTFPEEGTSNDYTVLARIHNGQQLLEDLGSLQAYDYFAADIKLFAETNYPEYQADQAKDVVGFVIEDYQVQWPQIDVSGRYGSVKKQVKVKIISLANEQIELSITDEDGLNIDNQLKSNSDYSRFLAKLPIIESDYSVEYVPLNPDKDFNINLYVSDPDLIGSIKERIRAEINQELDNSRFGVSLPFNPSVGVSY